MGRLVVEMSPKPGAELCCFPLKKKKRNRYSQVSYTPGFADHLLEGNMGEIWLCKLCGLCIPKDLEISVPQIQCHSRPSVCELPTCQPLGHGAAGDPGLQSREFFEVPPSCSASRSLGGEIDDVVGVRSKTKGSVP